MTNILLYNFGYLGDIIVAGQNFTRELLSRFPGANIDLMLRPRMKSAPDILQPLGLYQNFLLGEKPDFHKSKKNYDYSFIIDELVYPEGNLRTVFTKASMPFRLHPLKLKISPQEEALAEKITAPFNRPLIATQRDMSRKWQEEKVHSLWERLQKNKNLIVVGPQVIHQGSNRSLTFLESAALLKCADIYVGIDSGIAHAAALVGTQTVLIPPVFPESWISPTEYANPFIHDELKHHVSMRPPKDEFCGHYFCLRSNRKGGIARPGGNSLHIGCSWNRSYGIFKRKCCFLNISVDSFYQTVVNALKSRNF